jgi:hypothetical protein
MPGGRPRLYQDHEAFALNTQEYFRLAEERGKMPTLAGLCLHLGFDDKESFSHYASYGDEFSRTVKKARMIIEDDRNQRLSNAACTGVIFDLKHNHGWTDKSQTELTGAEGGPLQVAWLKSE